MGSVRAVTRWCSHCATRCTVSGRMHVCVSMYVMHEGIASWSVHLLVGRVDGQMRKLSVCLPRKRAASRAAGPLAPRLGLVSPESQGQHGREGNPLGATALPRWQYHVVGRVFLCLVGGGFTTDLPVSQSTNLPFRACCRVSLCDGTYETGKFDKGVQKGEHGCAKRFDLIVFARISQSKLSRFDGSAGVSGCE